MDLLALWPIQSPLEVRDQLFQSLDFRVGVFEFDLSAFEFYLFALEFHLFALSLCIFLEQLGVEVFGVFLEQIGLGEHESLQLVEVVGEVVRKLVHTPL